METLWFALVSFMLATYVVLDGFVLGAGVIHLLWARSSIEKNLILQIVGPVWGANEVWLIAAGGTLYFAFPVLYSVSFSGFYLPLMIVLWLLIMRGLGIELQSHLETPLWGSFFNAVFGVASLLLAIVLGAALGNVIRGVPLGSRGYFFEPLWTDFRIRPNPGILDWYTILVGLISLAALTGHGAYYVALKTEGDLRNLSRRIAAKSWWGILVLTIGGFFATVAVRPRMLENYFAYGGAGVTFPLIVFGSLGAMMYFGRRGRDRKAFLASSVYLAGMLGGVAFGLYPYVLPSIVDSEYGLTVHNAAAGAYGLRVGVIWWSIGITLVLYYFSRMYRFQRGKIAPREETH